MSNTPISGTKYLVRTKTGASNAYEILVCLTTNGWQATGDSIDTSSKCTGGYASSIAGRKGWTMSGEGQSIVEPDATNISFQKLATLWKSDAIFEAQFYNVDDADDIIRGDVRITALEKTAPDNANTTFSVTFTGVGEPFFTPAA